MGPLLFALSATLIAFLAWLRGSRAGARAVNAALATGAGAFALLVLFERIAAALPPVGGTVPRLLALLAALVLWGAVAMLAFRGARRRDLFAIVPFGWFTVLGFLNGDPSTGGAVLLALPLVARWRWRPETGRRALGWTTLGAVVVPLLAFIPVPGDRAGHGVPGSELVRCIAWARELAGLYVLLALPGLVRLWSLSLRRVSRRLALLLLLTGIVPVLLVLLMWGLSTQLGVGAERALFSTRLVEQTGSELRAALQVAGAAPVAARDPLSALAAAHPGWSGLRLWRDGRRVHGAPVGDEAALARWPDSLPQQGLVIVGHAAWLGARAAGPAGTVVALAPIRQVFDSDIERLVSARLALHVELEPASLDSTVRRQVLDHVPAGGAARDSLGTVIERAASGSGPVDRDSLERAIRHAVAGTAASDSASPSRRAAAHTAPFQTDVNFQPAGNPLHHRGAPAEAKINGLHLSLGGSQVSSSDGFSVTAGHGLLDGIGWTGTGWQREQGLVEAELRWGDIALGLFQNVRENPLNFVPLFFIALLALLVLMIGSADLGMVRALGHSITAAVHALRHGAERLEAGELGHRIEVQGEDELWDVAGAFNHMAVGLERGRQLEIERQRIESELGLARRIQARLLPPGPPVVPGLELAGTSESAREVGGDYYDYLPLGDGRVALVIADVSGKGAGAALLMSAFRASLMSQDLQHDTVATVLARLNRFLHRSVEPGRFVTAFLAVLDGASGRLVYSNAGHNAPLLLSADGTLSRLEAGGLILGILEDGAYETGEVVLAPGDRLVLFTDGVTEAMDEHDEQWGEERLIELLRAGAALDSATLIERIVEAVRRFEGDRGASDDVTLIVAGRRTDG